MKYNSYYTLVSILNHIFCHNFYHLCNEKEVIPECLLFNNFHLSELDIQTNNVPQLGTNPRTSDSQLAPVATRSFDHKY